MPFLGGRGQASRGYFGGATTPGAPTSVVSTKGNGQISVAFTAPSFDGGLPITTYEYALSTDSYATFTTRSTGTTASPLVITGLANGTSYGVKIRAVNSLGAGVASDAATAVTPSTVPNAPTSLSSTAGNTQLTISFTAPSNNGGLAITNYEYALSTNSGSSYGAFTALSPADGLTPVTITGLINGTAYYVKLRAVNGDGSGTESAAVTTNTMPFTTPSAPTSLSSVAGNQQLSISFTPGSSGGPPITNYAYALSTNSGSSYGAFTALSPADAVSPITIGGLSNATTYYVKLLAITSLATGAESAAVTTNTTPYTIPSAITNLSAARQSSQTVRLSFTAPSNNGESIDNYEYRYKTTGGYGAWTSSGATASPIDVGSLTNGTSYTFQVRAVNDAGAAGDSNEASATPYTIPTVTIGSTTNFNQDRATFNATFSNGGSAITNIEWRLSTNNSSFGGANSSGTTTYYNATGLSAGTTYYAQVRATNAAGTSAYSASSPVITTWSLQTLLSTTSTSLTIPTITPTGGSRINPSIYEVVIFGGGGNRGTYNSAGGGAAYKTDASVEVTQGSGSVGWTIGGTGGGTTTVTGLSVGYSAAGGGNGSNDSPTGPSAYVGGDGWGAMTSGGSGGSGNGNAAGAGSYYAEEKSEGWAYGGGGGSGSAGGASSTNTGGTGGSGSSHYGINGGGGGGGGYGYTGVGGTAGSDGSNRTYGGGANGDGASAATAGVVRFKYYGA